MMTNFIRTNSTVNEHGWDEPVLVKPFSCDGEETFMDATHRTKGVLRIYPATEEIEINIVSGCDPHVIDIVLFLLNDKEIKLLIKNYFRKGRKKPFSIRRSVGQSGREDVYINFPDKSGLIVNGRHLMHISCFGKISGIKKMYIGDFWEMIAECIKSKDSALNSYAPFTTCKYEKPYFATEIKTGVTRI